LRRSAAAEAPGGALQNADMNIIDAVLGVLVLVAALIMFRYAVNRRRRVLDRYRKHRARQTRTGGSRRAQSPDTISARSDMRALEDSCHPPGVVSGPSERRVPHAAGAPAKSARRLR